MLTCERVRTGPLAFENASLLQFSDSILLTPQVPKDLQLLGYGKEEE